MSSGHLNDRRFDGLWVDALKNGWDVRDGDPVLVVAVVDEETGKPFTQKAAFELLDEVDLAQLEAWADEQGQELGPLFESLPVRVSLTSFPMAKAA